MTVARYVWVPALRACFIGLARSVVCSTNGWAAMESGRFKGSYPVKKSRGFRRKTSGVGHIGTRQKP
jgi:hypothetical protein